MSFYYWVSTIIVGYIAIATLFYAGFGFKVILDAHNTRKKMNNPEKLKVKDILLGTSMSDALRMSILWPLTICIYALQYTLLAMLIVAIVIVETIYNKFYYKN